MPRYRICVEYHGGRFHGWQRQAAEQSTVQAALEQAIAVVCQEEVRVFGAGRTDAGVHALGQVAHFDLRRSWREERLRDAVNSQLRDVGAAVLRAETAPDDFHARFDAVERRYVYRILVRRAPLTLERGLAWRRSRALDVGAMRRAAAMLVGRHDFTTFRAAGCQASSPSRTLDELDVRPATGGVVIVARARSFLQHQVRGMVGTLERVGSGAWQPEEAGRALRAADRAACGPLAPPDGLYLESVRYPAADDGGRATVAPAADVDAGTNPGAV